MRVTPSGAPSPADLAVLRRLSEDELHPVGQFAAASNATLLCRLGDDGVMAVYKPERGEAPLWDFPQRTLHRREVAAYVIDRALGWGMVPPTVLREQAPYGRGSVQLFVEHDPDQHYFALMEEPLPEIDEQLRRMVLFDIVVNNADRKGSHVLLDAAGRIHLVDHGVCFHVEPKLRTVAWDFVGQPTPVAAREEVGQLAARLADPADTAAAQLALLLTPDEVVATAARAAAVARLERFPAPTGERPFPWPPL